MNLKSLTAILVLVLPVACATPDAVKKLSEETSLAAKELRKLVKRDEGYYEPDDD